MTYDELPTPERSLIPEAVANRTAGVAGTSTGEVTTGCASRLHRRWSAHPCRPQDDGGPVNSRLQDADRVPTGGDDCQVTIWAQQRNLQASGR